LQGYVLELTSENLFIKLDENNVLNNDNKNDNYLFAIRFFQVKNDANEKDDDDNIKLWILGHL